MVEKITFTIGGTKFSIHPLNFEQMDAILPRVAALKEAKTDIGKLVEIVQIMVSEDYPEAKIGKLPFDLAGLRAATTHALAGSGFEFKSVAPGEVPAGADQA